MSVFVLDFVLKAISPLGGSSRSFQLSVEATTFRGSHAKSGWMSVYAILVRLLHQRYTFASILY